MKKKIFLGIGCSFLLVALVACTSNQKKTKQE